MSRYRGQLSQRSKFAERGVAQLEYLVILTGICIPLFFGLAALGISVLQSYVNTREVLLYGRP